MKINKEKIKEFVKKHKVGLAYAAGASVAIVGTILGDKIYEKRHGMKMMYVNKNIANVLTDANKRSSMLDVFTGCRTDGHGFNLEQMGELGKSMTELDIANLSNAEFTNFIMIGPAKET